MENKDNCLVGIPYDEVPDADFDYENAEQEIELKENEIKFKT